METETPTREEGVSLYTPEGDPFHIDLFTKDVPASHTLMVGAAGTGKSFLLQQVVTALHVAQGAKAFLVDRGGSYTHLVERHDGSRIRLVEEEENGIAPTCLNPLHIYGARPTKREQSFIRGILLAMLQAGQEHEEGPARSFNKPEQAVLLDALQMTFEEINGGREEDPVEVTLSDYIERLRRVERNADLGNELADRLHDYTQDGPYGALFDGKLGIDWSADLIVFDEELMMESPALSVATLALLSHIEAHIKHCLPREQKKIVGLDEVIYHLGNRFAANQLAGFYRETRKCNTAAILLAQTVLEVERLVENAGGGILENTPFYFFLKASGSRGYEVAARMLELTDEDIASWRSLSPPTPAFSEVLYHMRQMDGGAKSRLLRVYPEESQGQSTL